jgi:hypothetical protein
MNYKTTAVVEKHEEDEGVRFLVLHNSREKFDCLIFQILFVRDLMLSLNAQADAVKSEMF